MANTSVPIANMGVVQIYVTDKVQDWMDRNPDRVAQAFARDQNMQTFARLDHYKQYQQGSSVVIARRMQFSDAGTPAIKLDTPNNNDRKGHCSLCEDNVNDFTRHNREHHIKNPGELWICPYVECSLSWHTFRDGTVTIDEHLANAHQDFRHKKGQAGAFLWRIPTMGTVKHLNSAALKHIARHHHGLIKNYINARNDALDHLMLRQLPDPGLAALPASAIRIPHADVTDKAVFPNKGVIWKYLIKLRSHIALWDDAINMAKSMIEEDAGKLLDMHIAQQMPLQNGQDYAMPVAEPMPMENEQIQDMFMAQPMPFLNSQGYAIPMAEPMSLENAQVEDMFMGQQMPIQNYQDYAIQMPEPMHVEDGQAHGMFVPDAEMNPEFYGFDIDADADMDLGF